MQHIRYTPVQELAAISVILILLGIIIVPRFAAVDGEEPSLLRIKGFGAGVKATEVVPAQHLISRMHWGAKDTSGLQLGAYYDPKWHQIACLIRNTGAHAVTMNGYELGCWGYIKVYARIAGATEWTKVSDGTCGHGAGPNARDNVTVQSGQYLIREILEYGNGAEHRTITRIEGSFFAMANPARLPNPKLKPVEFRVEHRLPNDGSLDVWQGTLSSPVLSVPVWLLPHPPADSLQADRKN